LQGKPQLKNISLDGAVRNIDDSPTDNLLYVEGFNGSLWSMNITGDMDTSPARMPEHRSTVTQHAFSSDSRFLATGDNENKVVLWDLRCKGSPAPIALTGHEGAIRTLQFVGNDHWLVSTSDDGTARRWDIGRSLPKNSLLLSNSCRGELETSRLSVDGRWLASGTAGGSVLLYDLASVDPSANALELGTDKKSPIKQIWFDPANKWLFASQGNLLHVWDLAASSIETSRRDIGPLQEDVKSLSVTAASRFLVVSWYGGNALITDLTQTDLTANAKSINFPDEKIDIVDLSPDGRWLAATSYDRLAIWDLSKSGGGLPVPVIFPAVESFIQAIHFTRDSKRVMTVSNSGRLSTWEMPIKSDRPSLVVDLADRASDVTFSENDRWIAVSTTVAPHLRMFLLDGTADTPTYIVPKGSSENNGSVALSKDGRWLAYASYRGAIQVWETSHLDAEPWVVAASFPQIGRIGFSNDGNWLAIGSELGDVSSVEMTEAGPLNPVSTRHHQDSVQFVGFSAHNRWLISQSASELRLTPLTTSELLELAARGLGRNFSPIEWSTYFAGQAYRKTIERLPAITLDPTNK
jgi:WD40 repeat protein